MDERARRLAGRDGSPNCRGESEPDWRSRLTKALEVNRPYPGGLGVVMTGVSLAIPSLCRRHGCRYNGCLIKDQPHRPDLLYQPEAKTETQRNCGLGSLATPIEDSRARGFSACCGGFSFGNFDGLGHNQGSQSDRYPRFATGRRSFDQRTNSERADRESLRGTI